MTQDNCILCMIAKNKIPSKKLYEDDEVIAVLDVNGSNQGHSFVFAKNHFPILEQVPDNILTKLFLLSNKISSALFDTLNIQGTNIFNCQRCCSRPTSCTFHDTDYTQK